MFPNVCDCDDFACPSCQRARDLCPSCVYFGFDYEATQVVHAGTEFLSRYEGVDHDDAWYLMTFTPGYFTAATQVATELPGQPYEVQMLVFEQLVNGIPLGQAVLAARLLLHDA